MNDVGVDAVGKRHRRNRRTVRAALRHDPGLEFWAVEAPLGVGGDRLARHGVHDLHRAHDACSIGLSQDGFAGRIHIEREAKELKPDERKDIRQQQTRPVLDALHQWMLLQRQKVPDGSATAKALDYSLRRWEALTRFVDDGRLPIDNNWIENQIRPIAIGRNNWLFAGSLRAGQRAAAVMSLIQSARMNGHDPYAYLKDVLTRLPTHKASRIDELLPHRWQSGAI